MKVLRFLVSKFGNISALRTPRPVKAVAPVRDAVNPSILGIDAPRIRGPFAGQAASTGPVTASMLRSASGGATRPINPTPGFLIALVTVVFRTVANSRSSCRKVEMLFIPYAACQQSFWHSRVARSESSPDEAVRWL